MVRKVPYQAKRVQRTKGGHKTDPGGAPASTAPFPELASESAAISLGIK